MDFSLGLAVFVKTPEHSPVKTRLAADIGKLHALAFYEQSLLATQSLMEQLIIEVPNLSPYWAVAELPGISSERWKNFPKIFQGQGGLGDRLHLIYEQLLSKHSIALLMGSDSPHLDFKKLGHELNLFKSETQKDFLMGKTSDGGFYLFGGKKSLPLSLWKDINYSTHQTAAELETALKEKGSTKQIFTSFDIDQKEDLVSLAAVDQNGTSLTQVQLSVIHWAYSNKHYFIS